MKIKCILFMLLILMIECKSLDLKNACDHNDTLSYFATLHLLSLNYSMFACGQFFSVSNSIPETPTFVVSKNNSIIESGFIIGKAATDVIVEVSLDDSSYSAAEGSSNWKYQLPTGSNTWKLGSLHQISIRSSKHSNYSAIQKISVRKGKNKDINGDGFPDIIIGSASENSNFGQISIFHGKEDGVTTNQVVSANTTFSASAFGRLGFTSAAGDFNGDGYSDVVTGSPRFDLGTTDDGRIYILYGSSNGISSRSDSAADTIISASNSGGWFGSSVASGDLNGDGYDEVIVGSYLYPNGTGQGRIYIINGKSSKIQSGTETAIASATLTGTSAARLGEYLQTADFNQDGITDLVSGATAANNGTASQGKVYLFYGTNNGIAAGNDTSANAIITGTNGSTSSRLGCSLGFGDINGDGIHDLLLTACAGNGNGRVYIFHGSKNGIVSANDTSAINILTSTKTSGIFGNALSTFDMNGDSIQDLVVGSPAVLSSLGEAYIFKGSTSGISATSEVSADVTLSGTATSGQFGYTVSPYDYNADGLMDLLISSPAGSKDNLYFFKNTSASITGGNDTTANHKIQGTAGSAFGFSLVQ